MSRKILLIFISLILTATLVHGQISITAADVNAVVSQGNTYTSYADTLTAVADIGTPGMTSWNFSGVTPHFSFVNTSIDPATSDYSSEFPGANVCYNYSAVFGTMAQETWQYFTLGTDYRYLGNATSLPSLGSESISTYAPGEILYQFPLTLNTSWQQSYVETSVTRFQGTPISNSTANIN